MSVIIPTLNRPSLLDDALRSVTAQDLDGQVEVIVVNDGGQPVGPVVRSWDGELAIKLIELDQHRGPAAARNAGVQVAAGDYIAFLDDDDLFGAGHLSSGCGPLARDEADFVYLGAVVSDHRLADVPQDLTGFPIKAYPYDHRFLLVANFLHTGSVIARNFTDTPVRFDESLDVCEDWDLWLALVTTLRYRVAFIDKITSIYHQMLDTAGLVAMAQLTSPSKFEVARDYINAKWPSSDPIVCGYREWSVALERHRSDLIATSRHMPNLLFDKILQYLHQRISSGEPAQHAHISQFFTAVEQPQR